MKIAVFGLVGEALNTKVYYFGPRRGVLLEIDRYLPACLCLRLARRCGVKTGNSWRGRF
nr:MAG TPA: hypothetical protein [Caudoviricetes sp.]